MIEIFDFEGMSMTRSRFGRQPQQESSSNYTPNLSESLCKLLSDIKTSLLTNGNNELQDLNTYIMDFYEASLKLLFSECGTDKVASTSSGQYESSSGGSLASSPYSSSFSSQSSTNITTPLSELTSSIKAAAGNSSFKERLSLPECIFVLFCVLFDIQINEYQSAPRVNKIVNEYLDHVRLIQELVLGKNEFLVIFKIGLFIKVLRMLFETKPAKNDIYDRRITDLMRSEFSVLRFDDEVVENSGTSSHNKGSAADQAQFNFILMYCNINQLLFKHMTENELEKFVYNQGV